MSTRIYKGDCMELLKQVETESVDLILIDPPFGTITTLQKYSKHKQRGRTDWDEKLDMLKLFGEFDRVLRYGGKVVMFSQEPFTTEVRQLKTTGLKFSYPLVWFKNVTGNALSANRKPVNVHEDINVYYKENDTNMRHPLREYARKCLEYTGLEKRPFLNAIGRKTETFFTYHDRLCFKLISEKVYNEAVDVFQMQEMDGFKTYDELKAVNDSYYHYTFNRLGDGVEKSVLTYAKDGKRYHPTQKPVALLEHLIRMYSDEGDTVLDSTMGSGSTGVACVNTGRNFIGIEKDDEYFNIAKTRIEESERETSLF